MIVAIGAFDGFHRGHKALLDRAAASGRSWGVLTFRRHPGAMRDATFKGLFTFEERRLLERYFDIPVVCRIDFTPEISAMSPEEFLDYLAERFEIDGVVVGDGFRFGHERAGTTGFLERDCARRGWSVDIVPVQCAEDGTPICSTGIRNAVAAGDLSRAWGFLGYPFFCMSRVIQGCRRGRRLGFPTANIALDPEKVTPRRGVYASVVLCDGRWHIGAANLGTTPTFSASDEVRLEVNVVDFEGDLYGKPIMVFLLEHVRDEIRFEGEKALKERVKSDTEYIVGRVSRAFSEHPRIWEKFASSLPSSSGSQELFDGRSLTGTVHLT